MRSAFREIQRAFVKFNGEHKQQQTEPQTLPHGCLKDALAYISMQFSSKPKEWTDEVT